MALGGGVWNAQNKKLAGSYINFVTNNQITTGLGERGKVAIMIRLNYGKIGEFMKITNENFNELSLKLFGVPSDYYYLQPLRDVLKHSQECYVYRMQDVAGDTSVKASNTYAEALYPGTNGNNISIEISEDLESNFTVNTYMRGVLQDTQKVKNKNQLKANDFVTFKDFELAEVELTPLTGGTDGKVSNACHSEFLTKVEKLGVNTVVANTTDDLVKATYVAHNKHCREDLGIKYQTVMYNYGEADYEGIVNVTSKPSKVTNPSVQNDSYLGFWVAGALAGCNLASSCTNMVYDGELPVLDDKSQDDLVQAKENGEFVFHEVGNDIRVLADVNSLKTLTETKGEMFKDNKVIRIIDVISDEVSILFNTQFLGQVPNDKAGRISLWSGITNIFQILSDMRAIENFDSKDVTVEQGETKESVVVLSKCTIIGTMEKLYMTTTIQ